MAYGERRVEFDVGPTQLWDMISLGEQYYSIELLSHYAALEELNCDPAKRKTGVRLIMALFQNFNTNEFWEQYTDDPNINIVSSLSYNSHEVKGIDSYELKREGSKHIQAFINELLIVCLVGSKSAEVLLAGEGYKDLPIDVYNRYLSHFARHFKTPANNLAEFVYRLQNSLNPPNPNKTLVESLSQSGAFEGKPDRDGSIGVCPYQNLTGEILMMMRSIVEDPDLVPFLEGLVSDQNIQIYQTTLSVFDNCGSC